MKRLFACLLCLTFFFSGCVQPQGKESEEEQEKKTALLRQCALAEVVLPTIPDEPNGADWERWFAEHSPDKMGEKAYEKAYHEFAEQWDQQYEAYRMAITQLRETSLTALPSRAFTLYSQQTAQQILSEAKGENIVYSPANLYLALSMLSAVTDGQCRAELLNLLGQDGEESVRETANTLWRQLYQKTASGQTILANSLWLSDQQEYRQETVEYLAKEYYAGSYSVPMGTEEADHALAAWLNENTGGLLEDAANGLQTDINTVMALLSTLYFYDQWSEEFFENNTRPEPFSNADGSESQVDFMHKTQDSTAYLDGEGFQMAQLRFRSGQSMVFFLPDRGSELDELLKDSDIFTAFLSGIDGNELAEVGKVVWSIPKFDIEGNLELSDMLKTLGITEIFADGDFSPLADFSTPVSVAQVQHAARVKVDEKGCEAAAFTAILADATSAKPEQLPVIEMTLDRPFAFLITGVEGLPLFIGTVNML